MIGEVGRVAGGVDTFELEHLAELVHAEEAVFAQGDPAHARAVELGQRDDAVGLEVAVAGIDDHLARMRDLREGGAG